MYNHSSSNLDQKMDVKETLVLYPCLGMGHLNPFVELAKVFTDHGFAVTIAVIDTTFSIFSDMDPFISRISSHYPSISFLRLPKVTPPPSEDITLTFHKSASLSNCHLLKFLQSSESRPSNIRALVLDVFCSSAVDVAHQLHIPSYFFCSSSASSLASVFFFPTLQSQLPGSVRDLGNTPLHFPGLPPIPASDLPVTLLDRGEAFEVALSHFERVLSADGIMISTFESLEKRAVQAMVNGDCVPGKVMAPIYCIGPLVPAGSNAKGDGERHECLEWLDAQPEKSVVFLCFGSMGSFSAEQLKETATGLERSCQRFLWVVRSPPNDPDSELESLLPKGFLQRTREQGFVMKSWAPQAAVLGHKSVGGFVSHCGWNSTLEAVSSGVPMIGWPLYAEQRMNKIIIVEEMEIGVGIEGYDKGLVSADEVEAKILWLMESEEGKAMRDRVTAMKEKAVAAKKEGGSSSLAWLELVRALRKDAPDTKS